MAKKEKLPDLRPKPKRLSLLNKTTAEVELRRLVLKHRALIQQAVALENAGEPHTTKSGVTVPPRFDHDTCDDLRKWACTLRKRAQAEEAHMLRELREIPVYQSFLKGVWGCGTLTAAYLLASLDLDKAKSGDSFVKYCGLHVQDGRIGVMREGATRDYNPEMRQRLYIMLNVMWKGRNTRVNEYVRIWDRVKAAKLALAVDGKIGAHPARAFAHQCGWHSAARLFLRDLHRAWTAVSVEERKVA